jgi:hypothetical protein
MQLPVPKEMTGRSLIDQLEPRVAPRSQPLCNGAGRSLGLPVVHRVVRERREDISESASRCRRHHQAPGNDLDTWFSDVTRRQRDLQKELRSTDQSIAGTSNDIRQIEDELEADRQGTHRARRPDGAVERSARRAGTARGESSLAAVIVCRAKTS